MIKQTRIYDLIKFYAKTQPEAIALGAEGRSFLTYAQLLQQIDHIGASFLALGIKEGDRVAIVLPNGPEMALLFLGTSSFTTCAPLNRGYRDKEFEFYLTDLNAKLVITQKGMECAVRNTAQSLGIAVLEIEIDQKAPAGIFSFLNIKKEVKDVMKVSSPETVALILHTSGTTARPKIVPLTQINILASARNIGVTLKLNKNDRCLNVMPLFHIHGLMAALMASIYSGGSVFCSPEFEAKSFFTWYRNAMPTWFTAVPTIQKSILDESSSHLKLISEKPVRFIRTSSSQLPIPLMEGLKAVFKVPVIEAYGMTEASHQMASNPLDGEQKPGTVGKAAGPEVAIMDELGNLLPYGSVGEIVIKGENVTLGYENNPEANIKSFTNSWLRTGDQGAMDSEGYLTLTGRLKEMINRGGEKVSPLEVDRALLENPAISQAAAFSLPHPTLGEAVAAVVVLQKGKVLSVAEIRKHAATILAEFKVPQQILILDQIPKGATGKVQRNSLAVQLKEFLEVEFVKPESDIELQIAKIWSEALKIDLSQIGTTINFSALGGDSLLAIGLLRKMSRVFRCRLTQGHFSANPTIKELVGFAATIPAENIEELAESYTGEIYWSAQMKHILDLSPTACLVRTVEFDSSIDFETAKNVLRELVRHHDVFRMVISQVEGEFRPKILNAVEQIPISRFNFSSLSKDELQIALENESRKILKNINEGLYDGGLLYHFAVIEFGASEPSGVIFYLHHTITDDFSTWILGEDFADGYSQASIGQPIKFAEKTSSVAWVGKLQHESRGKTDVAYWQNNSIKKPLPPHFDKASMNIRKQKNSFFRKELSILDTNQLLIEPAKAINVNPAVLLATAQLIGLARESNQSIVLMQMVLSGRLDHPDHIDFSRTLGCLSYAVPVIFDINLNLSAVELVNSVTAQLGMVPKSGANYASEKFFNVDLNVVNSLKKPWGIEGLDSNYILFNYLGSRTSLSSDKAASNKKTPSVKGFTPQINKIRVVGELSLLPWPIMSGYNILDGKLSIRWNYREDRFLGETIAKRLDSYLEDLEWLAKNGQKAKIAS